MNILIYFSKKNPNVLKAERFFKERRIPFQLVDLKKQKISPKEIALFARVAGGASKLIDRDGMKALERPVAHMTIDSLIVDCLQSDPSAMISPIVRNGNKITVGADENEWKNWLTNNP